MTNQLELDIDWDRIAAEEAEAAGHDAEAEVSDIVTFNTMGAEPHDGIGITYRTDEDGNQSSFSMQVCTARVTYTHKCKFTTKNECNFNLGKLIIRGQLDTEFWHVNEHGILDTDEDTAGDEFCGRCAKTGRYIVGMENGKYVYGGGICYRCAGKGIHDQADRARNLNHDLHYTPACV